MEGSNRADAKLKVTEFTDPWCTWCWGSEPILKRVKETYGNQVEIDFVMGGLVEDMKTFRDHKNRISKAEHVAPHWKEASEKHGMPVDEEIWLEDPPNSTWPSNVGYKAAEFQGKELGHRYLRRMREAAASERKNIEKEEILLELAEEVGLNVEKFKRDLNSEKAREEFQKDRNLARSHGATGFPTFLIESVDEEEWLKGYHPFRYFQDSLEELVPNVKRRKPGSILEFVKKYDHVATREVEEVFEMEKGDAPEELKNLEDRGEIKSVERGNGYFWEPRQS
ncbi:hypothetical protein AKJ63_00525 [candidate division MSBL1 archaeon SCGC-AAA259D18]|uniref:DSBA-like thioredoxin domain-containing protein n=1 Tax=candidate division MSBL1 archaeon SCGC-AAA259D18 TaxID=1698262 RepID=A0A133UCG0_9EURY|nr:hypothetical protein AKJ63_00525 [candidate division MSBL1 archaeon SCGC-AAA259D18]